MQTVSFCLKLLCALGDPTLADGPRRLVRNAHRIEMRGESMRKKPVRPTKGYTARSQAAP